MSDDEINTIYSIFSEIFSSDDAQYFLEGLMVNHKFELEYQGHKYLTNIISKKKFYKVWKKISLYRREQIRSLIKLDTKISIRNSVSIFLFFYFGGKPKHITNIKDENIKIDSYKVRFNIMPIKPIPEELSLTLPKNWSMNKHLV